MATRVLFADDHALIRQGLKALLETRGFKIVCEWRGHCPRTQEIIAQDEGHSSYPTR
jgi:DNA-binding NarL/FixJ family response regulator